MFPYAFAKMHGLGNCFILMDDRDQQVSGPCALPALAKAVSDRNFGIGADGLILVCQPTVGAQHAAPLRMRIFNEDGSEAEMCGNGIRCFARFVVDEAITDKTRLEVETLAGVIRTRIAGEKDVEVDMGEPALKTKDVLGDGKPMITIDEQGRRFHFVSMGNPHAIAFVDDFDFDWQEIGRKVEHSTSFPNRTNVEFVKVTGPAEAEVKVWERGCGVTMACGTGACAVAVAGAIQKRLPRGPVTIRLPGGPLRIHWNEENRVLMTGPAVRVCKGVYWF